VVAFVVVVVLVVSVVVAGRVQPPRFTAGSVNAKVLSSRSHSEQSAITVGYRTASGVL